MRINYCTLPGRGPDDESIGYYLRRLRKGAPKTQVLAQLRLSPHGKERTTSLPGLNAAIKRYRRGQLPLIGWLFKSCGKHRESLRRKAAKAGPAHILRLQ